MDSIVTVLKDTPIPNILVVSGIVFLFLALAVYSLRFGYSGGVVDLATRKIQE